MNKSILADIQESLKKSKKLNNAFENGTDLVVTGTAFENNINL